MSCYERFLHPFYDAFCATDRPGDCTAGPTPPARGPLEPCRCVRGGSPLTRGAVATPSALGLFPPKRILRCHRKKCATIHVRHWPLPLPYPSCASMRRMEPPDFSSCSSASSWRFSASSSSSLKERKP